MAFRVSEIIKDFKKMKKQLPSSYSEFIYLRFSRIKIIKLIDKCAIV